MDSLGLLSRWGQMNPSVLGSANRWVQLNLLLSYLSRLWDMIKKTGKMRWRAVRSSIRRCSCLFRFDIDGSDEAMASLGI